MGIRLIRRENDPILREKCFAVKKITPEVLCLIDDMVETMYNAEGIGLAAPQVGISKSLVVIGANEEGHLELINPKIVSAFGEDIAVEGCLSFPGLYGEVSRFSQVTVHALKRDGEDISINAEGLLARVLQHEIDHLNGVLFVDRATYFVQPEESKS